MIRPKTRFMLIIAAASALGSLAVLACMLFWLHKESLKLEAQVAVIAASTAYQEEYTKLTNLLGETEPKRLALETHILKEGDIVSCLAELEQVGRAFSLDIETKELNVEP